MTSLERARAHLLKCQHDLFWARRAKNIPPFIGVEVTPYVDRFLAALSWVEKEQKRASLGDDPYNIGYAKGFHDAEYLYSECQ